MTEYEILEDKVLVVDNNLLDEQGNPIITEITLQEYEEKIKT